MSTETEEVQRLLGLGLRYFSYRQRSTSEITEYLLRKNRFKDKPELVNQVLQKLDQFKLLNDEQFTYDWAISRLNKGKGPYIIRAELKQKGIDSNLIDQQLDSISQEQLQQSAAKILTKYSYRLEGLGQRSAKSKAYKYLHSRGYGSRTINAVIDEHYHLAVK